MALPPKHSQQPPPLGPYSTIMATTSHDATAAPNAPDGTAAATSAAATAAHGTPAVEAAAPSTAATVAHAAPAAEAPAPQEVATRKPPKKRRRTTKDKDVFNDMFYELMLFRSRNGHTRVPKKSALGNWVTQLRREKLQQPENHSILTPDRIEVLNSIDFVWHVQQYDNEERWKNHYQQLVQFREQHGHANAAQSTPLGKWVKTQRENYLKKKPRNSGRPYISQERIDLLNQIGFQWTVNPPAVGWEARYQQLLEYIQQKGDPHVPQDYKPNVPLGRWVMKQRSQYSLRRRGLKNQLTPERIERLEALGFKWSFKKEET